MAATRLSDFERTREGGLECPRCGCRHFRTEKTAHLVRGCIDRRRVCRHCGKVVKTVEQVVAG